MDKKSEFLFNTNFSRNSRFPIDFHNNIKDIDKWLLLSRLYDDWEKAKINANKNNQKIPKLIHHIWLGSEIPKKYLDFINGWKNKHPGWNFFLWDEEKLNTIEMINKDLFLKLKNYGAKSDVARLEVLYQYGGIYLDTDFECLKTFDESLLINNFIAGAVYNNSPEIANGFIASKPKSEFIINCIQDLKKIQDKNLISQEIIEETGPFFLTKKFFNYQISDKNQNDKMLILPSNYFYPLPSYLKNIYLEEVYQYPTSISIGVHHWEASWNKLNFYDRVKIKLKSFKKMYN